MTDHAFAIAVIDRCIADLTRERDRLVSEQECGQDPVSIKLAELRARCGDLSLTIHPDGTVGVSAAAQLLGRREQTLTNWRWAGDGPQFRKQPDRRIRYALADIAEFLVDEGHSGS